MAESRNFPEGCPLRHPILNRLLGRSCLDDCPGRTMIEKLEVSRDDRTFDIFELRLGRVDLCGRESFERQLKVDEILGVNQDGEEVIYDAASVVRPRHRFVNTG